MRYVVVEKTLSDSPERNIRTRRLKHFFQISPGLLSHISKSCV